jgi:hypothetical protein
LEVFEHDDPAVDGRWEEAKALHGRENVWLFLGMTVEASH